MTENRDRLQQRTAFQISSKVHGNEITNFTRVPALFSAISALRPGPVARIDSSASSCVISVVFLCVEVSIRSTSETMAQI